MKTDAELKSLSVAALRSNTIVALGNSISDYACYPSSLQSLRPARRVISAGISGQKIIDIAYRWGATAFSGTVSGNQIPASGGVTVAGLGSTIYRRINSVTGAFRCRIAGVDGVMTMADGTTTPVWTFTRDASGSVVNVADPVVIEPASNLVEGSTSVATTPMLGQLQNATVVAMCLYNDITDATAQATALASLSDTLAMCRKNTFLVFGEWNGQARLTAAQAPGIGLAADAAASKVLLDRTISFNAALAAAYPSQFVDMMALIKAGGNTSQFTVSGTVYDVVDTTFLPDGIHTLAGGAGSTLLAGYVRDAIAARGF